MKRPLFTALAGYLAVLLLGATRGAVAAAVVAVGAALFFVLLPGRERRHRLLCAALVLLAAGSCLLVHRLSIQPAQRLDGQRAEVTGQVTGVAAGPERARVQIRLRSVTTRGGAVRVHTNLEFWTDRLDLQPGDELRLIATLAYAPDRVQERWQGRYVRSLNLLLRGDQVEQLICTPGRLPLWRRAADSIAAFRNSQAERVRNPLARALLFGHADGLTERQHRLFVETGTVHLLTFSGTHFAAIAFVLAALPELLGLPRRQSAALLMAVVAAVTALMGFAPSVTRAGLMLLLLHLGTLLGREADGLTSLALAGFLLCCWRPQFVQSASLALSMSATAGVIVFAAPLTGALAGMVPPWRWSRGWRFACSLVAVSLAASLLLFPVSMWIYGEMTTLSVPANLLTYLPMMGVMLLGAFSLVGLPVGGLTDLLADLCMALLERVSRLPGGMLQADSMVTWISYAAILLLFALWRLHRRREGCGPAPVACGTAAVVAAALLTALIAPADLLRVTMIDVGQGLSVLVQDGGAAYLVDCGSESTASAADRIALQLRRAGVKRLDGVILTHTHADHVNGLEGLLGQVEVGLLVLREELEPSPLYASTVQAAERAGIDILFLDSRLTLPVGRSSLTVYPMHALLREQEGDRLNNDSLLVLVQRGDSSLLLTGDAERETERYYSSYPPFADVDVLQVAHHGSTTSSDVAFLLQTRPAVALLSVGERNRYGHPSQRVLERLGLVAGSIYRTDRHGNITLTTAGDGVFTIRSERSDADE